jgi:hypothetical protein
MHLVHVDQIHPIGLSYLPLLYPPFITIFSGLLYAIFMHIFICIYVLYICIYTEYCDHINPHHLLIYPTLKISFVLFFRRYFFFYYIHMCIQCLGHFPPFPRPSFDPPLLPPLPPNLLLPGRNYFALVSSFVEERV